MSDDLIVVGPKHRPITKKEADRLTKRAFELERGIKDAMKNVHESWWTLADYLYQFAEERAWELLGYDTLEDFLAQPDLGLSRTTFFRHTGLWRELVVERNVDPDELIELEPSKVREVVPAIKAGDVKVKDALDDARQLGYRDVREKYQPKHRKRHGQEPDDSTPLDASAEPVRVQCDACGSWYLPDEQEDGDA